MLRICVSPSSYDICEPCHAKTDKFEPSHAKTDQGIFTSLGFVFSPSSYDTFEPRNAKTNHNIFTGWD